MKEDRAHVAHPCAVTVLTPAQREQVEAGTEVGKQAKEKECQEKEEKKLQKRKEKWKNHGEEN